LQRSNYDVADVAVLLATVDLRCCKHGGSLVDSCSDLDAGATASAAWPAALAVAIVTGTAGMHLCLLRSACRHVPPSGEWLGILNGVVIIVRLTVGI